MIRHICGRNKHIIISLQIKIHSFMKTICNVTFTRNILFIPAKIRLLVDKSNNKEKKFHFLKTLFFSLLPNNFVLTRKFCNCSLALVKCKLKLDYSSWQGVPTVFSNRSPSIVHRLTVLGVHKNLGQIVAAGLQLWHHDATVHLYSRFLGHAADSGLVLLVFLIGMLYKVIAASYGAGIGSRGVFCQIIWEVYKSAMYKLDSKYISISYKLCECKYLYTQQ